jgi:hypothetical protein
MEKAEPIVIKRLAVVHRGGNRKPRLGVPTSL